MIEGQARGARIQRRGVAMTQSAKEIGFDLGAGEKLPVHTGAVKAAHGTAIQSQCARRHYEIGALDRTVAESIFPHQIGLAVIIMFGVRRVRLEDGECLRKIQIISQDRQRRRGHGFFAVALVQMRL